MDNKIFNINDVSASDNFTYTWLLKLFVINILNKLSTI